MNRVRSQRKTKTKEEDRRETRMQKRPDDKGREGRTHTMRQGTGGTEDEGERRHYKRVYFG